MCRFLPVPSARRATWPPVIYCCGSVLFLSTPSARRATRSRNLTTSQQIISIHALREEGDAFRTVRVHHAVDFYPRPPRGGRQFSFRNRRTPGRISIHALREEGDLIYFPAALDLKISIHALREEGDPCRGLRLQAPFEFLSTPSARRATSPRFASIGS